MRTHKLFPALLLGSVLVAGCSNGLGSNENPRVLTCPGRPSSGVSTALSPQGGTVRGAWFRLTVPPNAISEETVFWMRPEESNRMQIEVVAEGQEDFTFRSPATLALSYEFCANVPENLRIYEVDDNGNVIEDFGGEIDRQAREVRVQVDHLSEYVLAEPS